jgi:hypothetical protein
MTTLITTDRTASATLVEDGVVATDTVETAASIQIDAESITVASQRSEERTVEIGDF